MPTPRRTRNSTPLTDTPSIAARRTRTRTGNETSDASDSAVSRASQPPPTKKRGRGRPRKRPLEEVQKPVKDEAEQLKVGDRMEGVESREGTADASMASLHDDPDTSVDKSADPNAKILVPTEMRGNQKHDVVAGTVPSDRAKEAVLVDFEEFDDEKDEEGETKVDENGYLKGGRSYAIKTFSLPHRHPSRLYMLGPQAAKRIGFRDTYVFFIRNPTLVRLWATEADRTHMDAHGLVPSHLRSRPIALVTARSMFCVFGHVMIKDGKWGQDDYLKPTGEPPSIPPVDADVEGRHIETRSSSMEITPQRQLYAQQQQQMTSTYNPYARKPLLSRQNSNSPFRSLRQASAAPSESKDGTSSEEDGSSESSPDEYAMPEPAKAGDIFSTFPDDIPYGPISNKVMDSNQIAQTEHQRAAVNANDFNTRLIEARRATKGRFWDMHTQREHFAENWQPTSARIQFSRVDPTSRSQKFHLDSSIHYVDTTQTSLEASTVDEDGQKWRTVGRFDTYMNREMREYPIALIEPQFAAAFPIHRTRFQQTR